jgi:hypothetical protein
VALRLAARLVELAVISLNERVSTPSSLRDLVAASGVKSPAATACVPSASTSNGRATRSAR